MAARGPSCVQPLAHNISGKAFGSAWKKTFFPLGKFRSPELPNFPPSLDFFSNPTSNQCTIKLNIQFKVMEIKRKNLWKKTNHRPQTITQQMMEQWRMLSRVCHTEHWKTHYRMAFRVWSSPSTIVHCILYVSLKENKDAAKYHKNKTNN